MTHLARATKHSDHWGNELWTFSLLPVLAANESGTFRPRQTEEDAQLGRVEPSELENLDESEAIFSEPRPLRVSRAGRCYSLT
jgi:hypothetical protein